MTKGLFPLLLLCVPSAVMAADRFVDASLPAACSSGSYNVANRNCSGSDGTGYKSLQPAIDDASPGDRIYLRSGTYTQAVTITKRGTASAPITIEAYAGEHPVLDGRGSQPSYAAGLIELDQAAYINISGLTITRSKYYGIRAMQSQHVNLSRLDVSMSNHGGIVFVEGHDFSLDHSSVSDNNFLGTSSWHEAVSFELAQNFSVTNSTVSGNHKEGIDAKYGAAYGIIRNNTACDNNGPNVYIDAASHIQVLSNTICDARSNTKSGLGLAIETSYNHRQNQLHHVTIRDNDIYGNAAGITFWMESGAENWAYVTDLVIDSNTIRHNNDNNWGGIVFWSGSRATFGGGNRITNNIIADNTDRSGAKVIRDSNGVTQAFTVSSNSAYAGEPSDVYGALFDNVSDIIHGGDGANSGGVAPPPPPGAPSGPTVTRLVLVNADNGSDLTPIANGAVINLAVLPTRRLNVRAVVSDGVRSVQFGYDANPNVRVESSAPYALTGDSNGIYSSWTPSLGSHAVSARPYAGSGASGTAGTPLRVSFTVIDGSAGAGQLPEAPPEPSPSPDPNAPAIARLVLVDAQSNRDLGPLHDGFVINLANVPTNRLNIRADTTGVTESIRFGYDGNANFRTESGAPYAFAGDSNGYYGSWTPAVGHHTVTATPFSRDGGSGEAGKAVVYRIVVINQP